MAATSEPTAAWWMVVLLVPVVGASMVGASVAGSSVSASLPLPLLLAIASVALAGNVSPATERNAIITYANRRIRTKIYSEQKVR